MDGFNSNIDKNIVISGGLASDKGNFLSTWIVVSGEAKTNCVSAIGLYGEKAKDLPASGLLFPLGTRPDGAKENIIIRTVLGMDEKEKSITFAGDVPEGATVSLMKSNNDKLITAALDASNDVNLQEYQDEPILNIAISCIGRKLVLKQRVEEELEATLENIPKNTLQVGFYSYGEISPTGLKSCDLHNQTMTVTTIWEKDA
jgi:hypothetical protein